MKIKRIENFKIFAATVFAAMLGAVVPPAWAQSEDPCDGVVDNAVSAFPITVDGQFAPNSEWSDVTPLSFFSDPDTGNVFKTCREDGNSFLWVAIAPGAGEEGLELYLLYDYLPRTDPFVEPGEVVAVILFPINLPDELGGGKSPISVIVAGSDFDPEFPEGVEGGSFFDVFIDLDLDGVPDGIPAALGLDIEAAVGFGPSPDAPFPHLIVELEVSLRIPAGFADPNGPLPGNGINPETGLYDPDPAFWGGSFAAGGDGEGPGGPIDVATEESHHLAGPIHGTAAVFQIHPDGSTTADSSFVPTPFDAIAEKEFVCDKLENLLAAENLSDNDRKRIEKAKESIVDSLEFVEEDGIHANSEEVFKEEKKAVKELLKALKDDKSGLDEAQRAELEDCIEIQKNVDLNLALQAIFEAEWFFGDIDKIEKAYKELGKANKECEKGKPDKAIGHYGHAWKAANEA